MSFGSAAIRAEIDVLVYPFSACVMAKPWASGPDAQAYSCQEWWTSQIGAPLILIAEHNVHLLP